MDGDKWAGARRRGAGGVRGAEEKGTGSGRNRENSATLQNIFPLNKSKEVGANKNRTGTRIKGYGRREF